MQGGSITGNRTPWFVYDDEHPVVNARDWHMGWGAGVFVKASERGGGSFEVSGPAVIRNNYIGSEDMTALYGTYYSNVVLEETTAYNGVLRQMKVVGPLDGARIGVMLLPKTTAKPNSPETDLTNYYSEQLFTEGLDDDNDGSLIRFFTADGAGYHVAQKDGEAYLVKHAPDLVFTVNGNLLTAACAACTDGFSASVTRASRPT